MRRTAVYILIGVAALSMMGVCLWRAKGGGTWDAGWGQGALKVSERAYHLNQINAVTNTWRDIARRAKRDDQGRINDLVFTCLVVDTGARRVWIESDGRILPECEVELPPQMEWKLHHATPDGMVELAPLSRFRIPGIYTRWLRQEQVFLAGTRDGQEHLVFSFNPSGSFGTSYGSGAWNVQIQWDSPRQTPEDQTYDSVVISDEAHERAKAQFGESGAVASEPDVLAPAKAAWRRVEKSLYQEIERQVVMQGLSLRTLELMCGPDYTAASASLHAGRSGLLTAFRAGPSSAYVYLQIDSLGNNVWYAKSAPHPLRPMPQRMLLDMEFLVSAAGAIPNRSRENLLAESRRKQQEAQPPPSKWRVNLPNGVTVEFIGLCENPSAGRRWWGPDGSPLGFAPYINYESYGQHREDRTIYEIAWRIHTPEQGRSSIHSSFQGAVGSYGREIRDRYGNRIVGGFQDTGWAFDKSRETTTLKVGVSVNDGPFAWATFKNISLVRGENQGFEIIEGEATE